jgi:hypothetical protein
MREKSMMRIPHHSPKEYVHGEAVFGFWREFELPSPWAPTLFQHPPSGRRRLSTLPMSTEKDVVACQP